MRYIFFIFRDSATIYWVGIGWREERWQRYNHECWDANDNGLWVNGDPPDGSTEGHCVYLLNGELHVADCAEHHEVLCAHIHPRKYTKISEVNLSVFIY